MNKKNGLLTALLTIFCILGVILLQIVVRVNAIRNNYTLYTFIFIAIMTLIIIFAYAFRDKKRRRISFNKPMLISWIAMCLLMLVSDIIVFKQYWFLSLILLIPFTGLYIVLGTYTTSSRDRLWRLFVYTIEISFLAATLFCFLYRPYTAGTRYSGLSANPNVYAMFLITVWCCIITRLDMIINNKANRIRALLPGIESGAALFFLYLTGSRTSFAAILFITLLWGIFRLYYSHKDKKPVTAYAVMVIGGAIPAFILSYVLLSTLPGIINHPVEFERDKVFTAVEYSSDVCYAADTDTAAIINSEAEDTDNDSSLLNRIIHIFSGNISMDTILNGRISVYKNYLNELNNTGHKKYNRKINGTNYLNAHNNALQIAYSYGIPAGILYVVTSLLSIIYSIRLYITDRNKRSTAVLPMLIVLAFTITSLTECILLPMQSLLAFAYYLTVGELINTTYERKSK